MQSDWQLKQRIQREYSQAIARLAVSIPGLGNIRSPDELTAAAAQWSSSRTFEKSMQSIIMSWITMLSSGNSRSWREEARKSSRGKIIYESLRSELESSAAGTRMAGIVQENAGYISSLPLDNARRATKFIAEMALKGERAENIARELLARYGHLTESRAKLIARTESSKAQTALTRARSEVIGLEWYVWTTSKDQRVRESHAHMDGVLIKWSDPPDPEALAGEKSYGSYHAGDIFNCRCYPRPLISPGDVSWPHKVCYNGRIQTMSLSRFREVA